MKKYFLILSVLLCSLLFSACEKEDGEENPLLEIEKNADYNPKEAIVYYETETVNLLCPGENGTIYTYNRKGKKFCEYDAAGNCVKEYPVEVQNIDAFSWQNGTFYYIRSSRLYAMDAETGVAEEIYTFEGKRFRFGRMAALEDSVFVIRLEQYNEEWADVRYDDADGYVYEGEELLCFHPSTGEMEKPDIPNIKQINRKNNQELLVYAYDEEGGFYFTVYHTDGTLEEKRYTGLKFGTVNDMAYDEAFDRIVCTDFSGVFLTRLDDLSGKAYAYENSSVGYNTLTCADGFTYDLFTVERKDALVRLENRLLVRDTPTFKVYTLNNFYNPKRYGYPIHCEDISEEEMAMILLAGDSDYDFLILDTSHPITGNIRKLGSYYPLNDLDGMSALLEDCHAYVKEAATAENGAIWMLPLDVECPVLFYNEDLIEDYNLTLSHFFTYAELIDQTVKLPNDGSVLFSVFFYLMTEDIINQYLGNYAIQDNQADFHKEVLRTYLDILRKYDARVLQGDILFSTWSVYSYMEMYKEYYTNMLFSLERSTASRSGFHYEEYPFIHALPAPGLLEGEQFKNQAQAFFIVVNPNSVRMQWVLEYLSEVCAGIRGDENSLMLKTNDFTDRPIWQEMQAILANAEIYFTYPYEIVWDEINAYLREGKSYEDTVNEMERKMNMYLNE